MNLYSYVQNNPLGRIDADGHDEKDLTSRKKEPEKDIVVAAQNTAQQQVSQAGQDFIKGYEKLSLTVYDASKGKVKGGDWTIGYGHKSTKGAGPITLPEAEALFQSDVARMASHVAADLDVPVSQNQFDALVSLRFNAGANAIRMAGNKLAASSAAGAQRRSRFAGGGEVRAADQSTGSLFAAGGTGRSDQSAQSGQQTSSACHRC